MTSRSADRPTDWASDVFDQERMIPLHDPQQLIAGLVRFLDAQRRGGDVTIKSVLAPIELRGQYLP